jgi:hypothetical protein
MIKNTIFILTALLTFPTAAQLFEDFGFTSDGTTFRCSKEKYIDFGISGTDFYPTFYHVGDDEVIIHKLKRDKDKKSITGTQPDVRVTLKLVNQKKDATPYAKYMSSDKKQVAAINRFNGDLMFFQEIRRYWTTS